MGISSKSSNMFKSTIFNQRIIENITRLNKYNEVSTLVQLNKKEETISINGKVESDLLNKYHSNTLKPLNKKLTFNNKEGEFLKRKVIIIPLHQK